MTWLSRIPSIRTDKGGKEREPSALQFPGFDAAKPHLEAAALSQSLDPALVIAVAAAESAFNEKAVSRKGALGLMQVMPATAERYGVSAGRASDGDHAAMEPKVNAQIGSRYLADLLRMFDGDKELALAAYNAGEGAVLKYGRQIPLSGNTAVCCQGHAHLPCFGPVRRSCCADETLHDPLEDHHGVQAPNWT